MIADSFSNHNYFMRGLNWMSSALDHEVQRRPGNLHRAMPNYVARMWLRSADGGITAALYGPGELHTTVGADQTPIHISAQTRYPFAESIEFTLQPARPSHFAFSVRIPAWCSRASVSINGQVQADAPQPGSFYVMGTPVAGRRPGAPWNCPSRWRWNTGPAAVSA